MPRSPKRACPALGCPETCPEILQRDPHPIWSHCIALHPPVRLYFWFASSQVSFPTISAANPTMKKAIPFLARRIEINEAEPFSTDDGLLTLTANQGHCKSHRLPPEPLVAVTSKAACSVAFSRPLSAKAKGRNARKTRIRIVLMTIFFRGGSVSCRTGRVRADCLREACQPYPWRARNGSP